MRQGRFSADYEVASSTCSDVDVGAAVRNKPAVICERRRLRRRAAGPPVPSAPCSSCGLAVPPRDSSRVSRFHKELSTRRLSEKLPLVTQMPRRTRGERGERRGEWSHC